MKLILISIIFCWNSAITPYEISQFLNIVFQINLISLVYLNRLLYLYEICSIFEKAVYNFAELMIPVFGQVRDGLATIVSKNEHLSPGFVKFLTEIH